MTHKESPLMRVLHASCTHFNINNCSLNYYRQNALEDPID
jgi:hypothetical protein